MLGYGAAALLTVAAVTVLVVQVAGGSKGSAKAGSSASPGSTDPSGAIVNPGGQASAGSSGTGSTGDGALVGASTCGASQAAYQRSGDTVRVTVTLPPTGIVSASILIKGQGAAQTKALNVAGEQSPHVFEFTGAPAALTESISVSVLSGTDFKTCALLK
jgi:hypothetical protein